MSERTIRHHLEKHIRPVWRAEMAADLHVDLAKTAEIERAAWKRHERTGHPSDLAMAKWAIEYRAKVFGHYSAAKVSVNQGGRSGLPTQQVARADKRHPAGLRIDRPFLEIVAARFGQLVVNLLLSTRAKHQLPPGLPGTGQPRRLARFAHRRMPTT